jgi:glyoxylase-like metal-dependent hydrolase (beta-lactamase superfamily II)
MNRKSLTHRFLQRSAFASAVAALALASTSIPVSATAPMVKTQAPGFYRMMLGDFEVTVVSDGTVDLPVDKLLNESAEQTDAALKKSYLGSPLELSDNTFLINTGSRLVLVDTGAGTLLGPTLGKLISNMRAAGYAPEQVDDVLLTHMHPDHVGGLMLNGQRAFPNAIVHANKHEAEYWLSKANLNKAPKDSKGFFQGAMASVQPYVDAGKFKSFTENGEIVPGVSSVAIPGHTVGHTAYLVQSNGHELLLVGDSIHVAPVQFKNPTVTIAFDTNPTEAADSRSKIFARAYQDGAIIGADHQPFPGLGHVVADENAWQWLPVNYTTEFH